MAFGWFAQSWVMHVEEILYSYHEYMERIERIEQKLGPSISDTPTFSKFRQGSQVESIVIQSMDYPEVAQIIKREKASLSYQQQRFLEMKYFLLKYDYEIWEELGINRNKYYDLRKELIIFFAKHFKIIK